MKNPLKARPAKAGGSTVIGENWFDQAADVPRALDINSEHLRKRDNYRKLFNIALVGMILTPLVLFIVGGQMASATNALKEANANSKGYDSGQVINRVTSPGRYTATSKVTEWLSSIPSPLPGGSIQSWNGSKVIENQVPVVVPQGAATPATTQPIVTSEQFTLVDGTGRGYTAEVQVATDPRGGSFVIAGPSLLPLPQPVSGAFDDLPIWANVKVETTASDSVNAAAGAWASAYTSGDADRLRLTVGDPDPTHSYVPIAGVASAKADVTAFGTVSRTEDGTAVPYVLARVNVTLNWLGRSDSNSPAPMVMDLLVAKPDTAAPQVVAWGAPGSGPDLRPYQNSIPTQTRIEAPTLDPNATPTVKPGDTGGIAPTPAATQTR